MNRLSKIRLFYLKILKRHPIVVQSVQTGVLISTGDLISQKFVEKKVVNQIDVSRNLQFFVTGVGVVVSNLVIVQEMSVSMLFRVRP